MSAVDVAVIIPVYNGESTLNSAINSVLNQGIESAEIIIINDGSSDNSQNILNSFPKKYKNFDLYISRQSNCGLASTLNKGIELSKSDYIARQDQDDLALPGRFARQFAFLKANPDIAMVGTWTQIYSGDTPTNRYHRHPISNEALQLELLFDNPFVHSSMMIRADVLREVGGYCEDKSRQPPEDYELWSRIARQYRVANLPEVLTVYREVAGSMSRTGENPFLDNVIRISAENLFHVLAPDYPLKDCATLADLYHRGGMTDFRSALTKARAHEMLDIAALRIGGNRVGWSTELLSTYERMGTHLDSRFLIRKLPTPLLAPARWLKNRLFSKDS